jgi:hypothetical protein
VQEGLELAGITEVSHQRVVARVGGHGDFGQVGQASGVGGIANVVNPLVDRDPSEVRGRGQKSDEIDVLAIDAAAAGLVDLFGPTVVMTEAPGNSVDGWLRAASQHLVGTGQCTKECGGEGAGRCLDEDSATRVEAVHDALQGCRR